MDPFAAVGYPTNDERWVRTLCIGAVLEALTFLVIPQIVLQGYYVRVMRETVAGEDVPPRFGDWEELLVDGTVATAVLLVYLTVPVAAFLLVVVPAALALAVGAQAGGSTGGGGSLAAGLAGLAVGLLAAAALFAVFGYAAAAALVAYAHEGRVRAAFSPRLLRVLFSREYLAANLLVLLVSLGAVGIKLLVGLVPVVNLLLVVLVPALVKYLWVVWARLWAQAYAEVVEPAPAV